MEATSDSYLIFELPWANVQMGKDAILWGPGYNGVVGLAGINPTFDIVKLPIEVWKLKFTSILGFLRDNISKQYNINDVAGKYLSAHRFELKPFSGVSVAWQEAYVYVDKLHLELINPIMLIKWQKITSVMLVIILWNLTQTYAFYQTLRYILLCFWMTFTRKESV